jgi:hypothetical protein
MWRGISFASWVLGDSCFIGTVPLCPKVSGLNAAFRNQFEGCLHEARKTPHTDGEGYLAHNKAPPFKALEGCLDHKKTFLPLGPPEGPRHSPTSGS